MLSERFAESILHEPAPRLARLRGLSAHVVLGQRLRPFAYWHAALLDWVQSPFIGHRRTLDLAAVNTAAHICTSRFPHANLPRKGQLSACLLQYRFGRFELRERAAFVRYLSDYNSAPIFGKDPNAGASKCPGYLLAVTQLRLDDASLSVADAWMTPLGEGAWRLAARAQIGGAALSSMLDDEDLKMFAEAGVDPFAADGEGED